MISVNLKLNKLLLSHQELSEVNQPRAQQIKLNPFYSMNFRFSRQIDSRSLPAHPLTFSLKRYSVEK